jgi:hypothetical protein
MLSIMIIIGVGDIEIFFSRNDKYSWQDASKLSCSKGLRLLVVKSGNDVPNTFSEINVKNYVMEFRMI